MIGPFVYAEKSCSLTEGCRFLGLMRCGRARRRARWTTCTATINNDLVGEPPAWDHESR